MRVTLVCGYMDGASRLITTKMVPNHVTDKSDKDYMINVSWVSLAKVEALSGNKLWTPNHFSACKNWKNNCMTGRTGASQYRNESKSEVSLNKGPRQQHPVFLRGAPGYDQFCSGDSTRGSTMIQIEILDPRSASPKKNLKKKRLTKNSQQNVDSWLFAKGPFGGPGQHVVFNDIYKHLSITYDFTARSSFLGLLGIGIQ